MPANCLNRLGTSLRPVCASPYAWCIPGQTVTEKSSVSGLVLRTGDPEVCQMRSLPAEWGTCSHMVGSPRAVRSRRRHLCQTEGYLNSLKELLFRQGG